MRGLDAAVEDLGVAEAAGEVEDVGPTEVEEVEPAEVEAEQEATRCEWEAWQRFFQPGTDRPWLCAPDGANWFWEDCVVIGETPCCNPCFGRAIYVTTIARQRRW